MISLFIDIDELFQFVGKTILVHYGLSDSEALEFTIAKAIEPFRIKRQYLDLNHMEKRRTKAHKFEAAKIPIYYSQTSDHLSV